MNILEKLGRFLKQEYYSGYNLLGVVWDKVNEIIENVNNNFTEVTNKFKTKTDLNGDHKGTWQGYRPSQVDAAITSIIDEHTSQLAENTSQLAEKANQVDLYTTNLNVANLANNKADKSEVTNVMTPKGTIAYASLPVSGNEVGWYYYCPDGDGTNGAGNYVWNGTSWYFGGTGDQGYSVLKKDIDNIGAYRLNEFNKDDITLGKHPNTTIGQSINTYVENENAFVCNQKWRVKKGDIIRWTWPYSAFAIYDENGFLIERLGSNGLKETTIQSDNAHTMVYYGTSASVNYIDNFMFTINRELPTEYVEYGVIGIDTYNDKKTNERIDKIKDNTHIPYIILNFDNQIDSLDNNVVVLLEKYGFKGSFVGWENPLVFLELLKRGWDIGTYDNSPDILPSSDIIDSTDEADIALYDNYVYQAQKKQSDIGIFNPTMWCSRQNKWGSALEHGVKKYGYKMARAYQKGDVYNLNYDKDFPVFDSQRFYTGDLTTVKNVIDTAINKPNSIVIILAHKLIDTSDDDRGFDCLASEYEEMLSYLKTKSDSGLIKVLTFRELYKALYPEDAYDNDYNRILKTAMYTN